MSKNNFDTELKKAQKTNLENGVALCDKQLSKLDY